MPQTSTTISPDLLDRAKAIHEQIRTWRRTLHQYPELSFTEEKTSQLVYDALNSLGIDAQTGIAKTGVVGTIGKNGSKTVGLRADMDALPIQEMNGTDFDSEHPGIMHACGHDAHTAMLLGAATLLKEMADTGDLPGRVKLLFQPSEEAWDKEGKSGGKRMVEEGALEGLDAVFGLHVSSRLPVGKVGTRSGPLLAAVDTFTLTVKGAGGHAAAPHMTVDPIALAVHVVNAIHQIVSRRINPIESGVLTIANINGGTGAPNVIDDKVVLSGTMRSMTAEVRQQLRDELKKAGEMVKALGGDYDLEIEEGYPVTVNDPEATESTFRALTTLLGEENVEEVPPIMGSEDFSYMAEAVPGCFVNLGVKNPKWEREYSVHTSTFRMDEDALPIGSALLVASALEWLGKD